MQSVVEGFSPDGGPCWRSWDGMLADVWTVSGRQGARGAYVSPHARLFVVLEETIAGSIHLSDHETETPVVTGLLSYIPPGVRTWSFVPHDTQLRHLDLHIDLAHLQTCLGGRIPLDRLRQPRLMFDNARILSLAHLLADDVTGGNRHDLFGQSLATAIWVELFEVERQYGETRGQLSPRRLRLATQHLEEHCLGPVRLTELGALVGLSPTYFCSAFKASTGLTPLQWQMQARLQRVKAMLAAQQASLSEIAMLCGFADQAHMTRVFKRHIGATPAAWVRREAFTT